MGVPIGGMETDSDGRRVVQTLAAGLVGLAALFEPDEQRLVAELRRRYVDGRLDEDGFERALADLLGADRAAAWADRAWGKGAVTGATRDRARDRARPPESERASDRTRERERERERV